MRENIKFFFTYPCLSNSIAQVFIDLEKSMYDIYRIIISPRNFITRRRYTADAEIKMDRGGIRAMFPLTS